MHVAFQQMCSLDVLYEHLILNIQGSGSLCLKLTNRADFAGVQNPVTQFLTSLLISMTARNYTFLVSLNSFSVFDYGNLVDSTAGFL